MCSRPSRSVNITVTALMRFSSVRYRNRSSWICAAGTRSLRCRLAVRFSSSSSPYESVRKSRSSVAIVCFVISSDGASRGGSAGRAAEVGTPELGLLQRPAGVLAGRVPDDPALDQVAAHHVLEPRQHGELLGAQPCRHG